MRHYVVQQAFCLFSLLSFTHCLSIPECPSLFSLEELEPDKIDLDSIPVCFCDAVQGSDTSITVSCLYGSYLDNMTSSIQAAKKAGYNVAVINTNHMHFGEGVDLPSNYFKNLNIQPETVSFTACLPARDAFVIDDEAFNGQNKLTHLTISTCVMDRVPPAMSKLNSLHTLVLTSDQIQALNPGDLMGMSNLKVLDIGENYLEILHPGSFKGLDSIEELVIGPNKYLVNDTAFEAVNSLTTLKSLALDGCNLQSWPEMGFNSLKQLQNLTMTKNDMVNLSANALQGLESLQLLDLRVNLLESIEEGAFEHTPNLKDLMLTGNYINIVNETTFSGLANLQTLSLGWNEFDIIQPLGFSPLTNLHTLDLVNNERLSYFQPKALVGLDNLMVLNLTKTNMTELTRQTLSNVPKLRELDLTASTLMKIDADAFEDTPNINYLSLNSTYLQSLDPTVFKSIQNLEKIDLSGNPWMCDDQLKDLLNWINNRFNIAAEASTRFHLMYNDNTRCNMPKSLRGESLLSLNSQQLQPYNPEDELESQEEYSNENLPDFFPITPPPEDYLETGPKTLQPGNPFGDGNNDKSSEPEPHPESHKPLKPTFGEPPKPEAETSSSVSRSTIAIAVGIVVVAGVSILVIVIAVLSMKKRKDRVAHNSNATEMNIKPQPNGNTNGTTNGTIDTANGKTRIHVNGINSNGADLP